MDPELEKLKELVVQCLEGEPEIVLWNLCKTMTDHAMERQIQIEKQKKKTKKKKHELNGQIHEHVHEEEEEEEEEEEGRRMRRKMGIVKEDLVFALQHSSVPALYSMKVN